VGEGAGVENLAFDATLVAGSFFSPTYPIATTKNMAHIKDVVVKNGLQIIDGLWFEHTTFIGTKISYQGGLSVP
jgi:hypothetical protein